MRFTHWREPFRRVLFFGSVDTALFPLNLSVAWALTEAGMHYLLATIGGFALQLTLAFFINRRWTFRKPEIGTASGLAKTWLIGASDLLVALIATALLVETFGASFIVARILAAFAVFAWDYVLNCIFTFKMHPLR